MKGLLLISFVLLLSSSKSFAWYCEEVGSERSDKTINSCGVATSKDEGQARSSALERAYREFNTFCSSSPDCDPYDVIAIPMRTSCKKLNEIYKCYRGVSFEITQSRRDMNHKRKLSFDESALSVIVKKKIIETNNYDEEVKEGIVSFKTHPEKSDISVDGINLCRSPCSRQLTYGLHKVQISSNDFEEMIFEIQVESKEQKIEKKLEAKFGYIQFKELPSSAIIKIDNNTVYEGSESEYTQKLKAGEFVVTTESPNHDPESKKIEIIKGEYVVLKFDNTQKMGHVKVSYIDTYGNALSIPLFVNGVQFKAKTPTTLHLPAGLKHSIGVLTKENGYIFNDLTLSPGLNEALIIQGQENVIIVPDVIRANLLESLPKFRYCYQAEMDITQTTIKGIIRLEFIIGPKGNVIQADIRKDSNLPNRLKKCVIDVLRGIEFPKPLGGGTAEVKQAMNFFTKAQGDIKKNDSSSKECSDFSVSNDVCLDLVEKYAYGSDTASTAAWYLKNAIDFGYDDLSRFKRGPQYEYLRFELSKLGIDL